MTGRLLTAAALAVLLVLPPSAGRAEGFGRGLDELVRVVERAPKAPEAELAALEAFARWDEAPEEVRSALEAMSRIPGLGAGARARVGALVATADLREGRVDEASSYFASQGFIGAWRVLGPFPADDAGISLESVGDGDRELDGLGGPVRWRDVPPEATSFGVLRLDRLFARRERICAFAEAVVPSERAGPAVMSVSAAGSLDIAWNGAAVYSDALIRATATPDRAAIPVRLKRGSNRFVARVCTDEGGSMALAVRLADSRFAAWPAGKRVSGEDAALYALLTGAVAAGESRPRDLARAACGESDGARPCLVWAALAADANERRRALAAALSRDAGSTDAWAALARLELDVGDPERALLALDGAPDGEPSLAMELVRMEALAARGLPTVALARLAEAERRFGPAPALYGAAMRISMTARDTAARRRFAAKLVAARFDAVEPHLVLAEEAAARGDDAALDAEILALGAVAPGDRRAAFAIADALGSAGRGGDVVATMDRALSFDPRDGEARKRRGLTAIAAGRREEGLAELRDASRLEPGDEWLADYLEEIDPAPRFEAPYVVPRQEFLARRGGARGEASILADVQVVRVDERGLVSRFTQIVAEIAGPETARSFRTHAIQFTPESQRVRVLTARVFRGDGRIENAIGRATAPVSEPWYRLYYDVEAELVELPPLEPGDVVEYAYRVDDIAAPGQMRGVFGDLVYVTDELPKRLWRYVLIAPEEMGLGVANPDIASLTTSRKRRGDELVEVFEARDVAPVAAEPHMDGESAGRAYLHISTFRTLDDLGRWYERLVREQTAPDDRIRELSRSLTRGVVAQEAKVAAIFDWVVSSTRYVGLEFGVHGFKPYPAPKVVARGFGDCKDKAVLLVALLGAAGVRAEVALVRTRSAGPISESPVSLEVFNHAVAYVPSLDLWLDGTAEHHGSRELPFEDQGALALRLTPSGPMATHTPVGDADASSLREELRLSVDAAGGARADVALEVRGANYAPAYRREFASEATRRERFAAVVSDRFPGSTLEEVSFDGLLALEGMVHAKYVAHVPGFGRRSGSAMSLVVDRGEQLSRKYAVTAARRGAMVVGPRRTVERSATVEVPDGFRVVRLPRRARISTDFGSLSVDAEIDDRGAVRLVRRFALDAFVVPAEDYPRFAAFCREVDAALAEPIVFEVAP